MPQFDLSPVAPASVVTPPSGYYAIFLNSSDADLAYKKDSAGVSTSLVAGFANPMTTIGDTIYGGVAGVATRLAAGLNGQVLTLAAGIPSWATPTTGTVTSVAQSFTGGLISVGGSPITTSGTLALTVAGTSGGIPYFSSGTTWASSAALAANALVIGGGAGVAPSTITTGTGVVTALGVNVGSAGAFVVNGGALGTPSSGTLTSCTGLPLTTGLIGGNWKVIYTNGAGAVQELTVGAAGTVLTGNGVTSAPTWNALSSGITVGTTTITSGTSLRIPYNLAGVYQEQANFTIGAVAAGILDVPTGYAIAGTSQFQINTSTLIIGTGSVRVSQAQGGVFSNTGVGFNSLIALTGGFTNAAFGSYSLGAVTTGAYNTAVGHGAGNFITSLTTGDRNLFLGAGTQPTSNSISSSIAIGCGAEITASNQIVFGGAASGSAFSSYSQGYIGNGVTNASATSFTLNATGGSGADNAGANFTKSAGKGTGTAASGNNVEQTSVKLGTGTTLQSLTDRHNIVGKYVDITGGAATTFGNLALATSLTSAGGSVIYTIEANDATDIQSLSGILKYDVVNKAGTLTVVYEDDQNGTGACSTGTLTATVTATTSGTNVLFQANAVSSLSETVLRISFQILNNMGVAIVTPA